MKRENKRWRDRGKTEKKEKRAVKKTKGMYWSKKRVCDLWFWVTGIYLT
jgi:hypothetical protein